MKHPYCLNLPHRTYHRNWKNSHGWQSKPPKQVKQHKSTLFTSSAEVKHSFKILTPLLHPVGSILVPHTEFLILLIEFWQDVDQTCSPHTSHIWGLAFCFRPKEYYYYCCSHFCVNRPHEAPLHFCSEWNDVWISRFHYSTDTNNCRRAARQPSGLQLLIHYFSPVMYTHHPLY